MKKKKKVPMADISFKEIAHSVKVPYYLIVHNSHMYYFNTRVIF